MLEIDEIEAVLPCPLKIEICCDYEDFQNAVGDSITDMVDEHNKKYDTEIDGVGRQYFNYCEEILEYNECKICVGKEVVRNLSGPDIADDTPELSEEYFKYILVVLEEVMDSCHDKIIAVQNENEEKLKQFEDEGYEEMLYGYYFLRGDKREFKYLKRLATRYPHSKYMAKLLRVYRNGTHGGHRKNLNLWRKMTDRSTKDYF